MYERINHPLLSRAKFLRRVVRHISGALMFVALALIAGILGYHYLGHLKWIDSFLNASMILGGMGPVDPLPSNAAKIFASCYAIFCGVGFIGIAGIMLAPFAHRLLHRFHIEGK